ncbi:hypothetical protein ZIOFF_028328 [Zingiber officinale]|uniref:DDE Tnp4 domain-containing protein n=1 Tax=Zingiber officinale TaxID=94328 RepID=A0A8J5GMX5_ZINOF|nr:hypothetical protein ZIOFF_028328 [Zingiber officinale]
MTDFSRFAFFIDGDKLLLLHLLQIGGDNKLLHVGPLESLAVSFSISVGVQLQEDLALGLKKRRNARFRRSISYGDQPLMDRRTLAKLCYLLTTHGQLQGTRNMSISELVISFLHIIAHNMKNRVLKHQTFRSSETVGRQFHLVLNSVLRLHNILLEKPEPIPENHTDERWKWFKGCLGALDGTYINVKVPGDDRPRYRTRKGEIATNVLGVCTPNMQFSYVLPGWEGSAADGRVLRDAISRRNGLKIPQATAKDVPTSQPVLLSPTKLVESSMPMKVKRKTHSTKHLWKKQEDVALVDCLVELSKDLTWKSENGFRTGYLLHLEKLMTAKVSSSNLKATPHIESRYKLLKRQFHAINEMINHSSGSGRSDVEKCITALKDMFDDWVKMKNMSERKQRNLRWRLKIQFVHQTTRQPLERKKRKSDDVLGDLVGEISKYVTVITEANEEMKGISTYFMKQTENSDKKMRIYDELMELSDFSQQEIMDVGEYILKDDHKVDNFNALPKAFRREYVMKQLSKINPYATN